VLRRGELCVQGVTFISSSYNNNGGGGRRKGGREIEIEMEKIRIYQAGEHIIPK